MDCDHNVKQQEYYRKFAINFEDYCCIYPHYEDFLEAEDLKRQQEEEEE